MKSDIVIIPIKQHSERIPGKNFALVNGQPLYTIFSKTLKESECFDKVVIDTDSDEIADWSRSNQIEVLTRLPHMTDNRTNGNMLLRHHVRAFHGYARYWQGFVTSPDVSVSSVRACVRLLEQSTTQDSVMTVKAHRGFYWHANGSPVNYRPDLMPRSQEMPPIYSEICGLFGVCHRSFEITGTRYGTYPALYELPDNETADIDWPEDLKSINEKSRPFRGGSDGLQ